MIITHLLTVDIEPAVTVGGKTRRPRGGYPYITLGPAPGGSRAGHRVRTPGSCACSRAVRSARTRAPSHAPASRWHHRRSEEHTSELQSHVNLVCRLLLEKKKKNK